MQALINAGTTFRNAGGKTVEAAAIATDAAATAAKSAAEIASATAAAVGTTGKAVIGAAADAAAKVTASAGVATGAALKVADAGMVAASNLGVAGVGAASNVGVAGIKTAAGLTTKTLNAVASAGETVTTIIKGPFDIFNSYMQKRQQGSNTTSSAVAKKTMIDAVVAFYTNEVRIIVSKLGEVVKKRLAFATETREKIMKKLCSYQSRFSWKLTCKDIFTQNDEMFDMLNLQLDELLNRSKSSLYEFPNGIEHALSEKIRANNAPEVISASFDGLVSERAKIILEIWKNVNAMLDEMTLLFSALVQNMVQNAKDSMMKSVQPINPQIAAAAGGRRKTKRRKPYKRLTSRCGSKRPQFRTRRA